MVRAVSQSVSQLEGLPAAGRGRAAERCPSPGSSHGPAMAAALSPALCLTVRAEVSRCRDHLRKATEELNAEKIKVESQVLGRERGLLSRTGGGVFTRLCEGGCPTEHALPSQEEAGWQAGELAPRCPGMFQVPNPVTPSSLP